MLTFLVAGFLLMSVESMEYSNNDGSSSNDAISCEESRDDSLLSTDLLQKRLKTQMPVDFAAVDVDLTSWIHQTPILDDDGEGVLAIDPEELVSYSSPYFYQNTTGGTLEFKCPVDGATTLNTLYTRSELRESNEEGDIITWDPHVGRHWLRARVAVRNSPMKTNGRRASNIIGQMHGKAGCSPPVKIYYYSSQKVRVQVKDDADDCSEYRTTPTLGKFDFNEFFEYEMIVDNGVFSVSINGGTPDVTELPANLNRTYFKAGTYCMCTASRCPNGDSCEVAFQSIQYGHEWA
jgi:hypothetical protein